MEIMNKTTNSKLLFSLGQTVATPGALELLEENGHTPSAFIARHHAGDWGDALCDEDKRANDAALKDGNRSQYATRRSIHPSYLGCRCADQRGCPNAGGNMTADEVSESQRVSKMHSGILQKLLGDRSGQNLDVTHDMFDSLGRTVLDLPLLPVDVEFSTALAALVGLLAKRIVDLECERYLAVRTFHICLTEYATWDTELVD